MAKTYSLTISPREQAAMAMWFLDVETPKDRLARRLLEATENEFGLAEAMDQLADPRTRPVLRSLSKEQSISVEVAEATVRYVREQIDPEKKPGITGHIHSVLGPLDSRLEALLGGGGK